MMVNPMLGAQLQLFDHPVAGAPGSPPVGLPTSEWRAEVPFPIDTPFDAMGWLRNIIAAHQPLIFLHGQNPHIVQVRCHASWETRVEQLVRRAWLGRPEAVDELLAAGYRKHGIWRRGYGVKSDFAEVYYKPKHEVKS